MSVPEGVEELTQTFLRTIGLNLTAAFRDTPEAIWVTEPPEMTWYSPESIWKVPVLSSRTLKSVSSDPVFV